MATRTEPSAFALTLAAKLKAARGSRTFQEVADATGGAVHPRMVQNYENGTEPRLSTFLVLAAALGFRPNELLPGNVVNASNRKDTDALVSALVSG